MPNRILLAAAKKGIYLYLKDGALAYRAQKDAMTPDLKLSIQENKAALIKLLEEQSVNEPNLNIIPRANRAEEKLVLSFEQQRLWLLNQIDGGSHYNMPGVLRLKGELNIGAINKAFSAIIERHESLRTFILTDQDGEPYQFIGQTVPYDIAIKDLTRNASDTSLMGSIVLEETSKQFDLSKDLMLRAKLIKLAGDEYILVVTMHHIASDGWSMAILINEFCSLYSAFISNTPNPLFPLPLQYVDYAVWQRKWLKSEKCTKQLSYWRSQLSDLPVVHNVPLDRPRPVRQTFKGSTLVSSIPMGSAEQFGAFCRKQGATVFMGIHAVFSILLARYSNETDIVMGSPIAGRDQVEISGLIGYFGNTLVLRSDLSGTPDFYQVLEKSKNMLLVAYENQHLPFDQIVEMIQPERTSSYSPIFQIMLVMQNNEKGNFNIQGVSLSSESIGEGNTAKFDLTLNISESASGFNLGWEYSSDIFNLETIQNFSENFTALLDSLIAEPEKNVLQIGISSQVEQEILNKQKTNYVSLPAQGCIHQLFEQQAAINENSTALTFNNESMTYAELNRKANKLAHYLVTQKAIKPDTLIGVFLDRSFEMLIAILGVLKAGGAYVPLDPESPEERVQYILEDASLITVITQHKFLDRVPAINANNVLCLDHDEFNTILMDMPEENPCVNTLGLTSANLAYVIYTSGSTGKPKGVLVEHRNVSRLMEAAKSNFEFSSADVWTLFHSYAFDFSVWEIWGALAYGGRLVIVSHEIARSPVDFYGLLLQQQVTVLNQTPSAFNFLLQEDAHQRARFALRYIIFGGEALNLSALEPWFNRRGYNSPLLVNMYGITETTVHVTYLAITPEIVREQNYTSVIGKPLCDLTALVLNTHGGAVPIGGIGELYVGGDGVTRGYLNQPELTNTKFVQLPEHGNKLFYKTGDIVRLFADGSLDYLGRIDSQVKIRGYRIELGEIETVLNAHPHVNKAVVVTENELESKCIVAYVAVDFLNCGDASEKTINLKKILIDELRDIAKAALPGYMVPSIFFVLNDFPLTNNGKIDLRKLPKTDEALPQKNFLVLPGNELEKKIHTIWCELLNVPEVSVNVNFFEIGGNSLLAVRLQARIRDDIGIDIPVTEIFTYTTIHALAGAIASHANQAGTSAELASTSAANESLDPNVPIAIIGMAGRFPDAQNIEEYWSNLSLGLESIQEFSDEELSAAGVDPEVLENPTYVKKGHVFHGYDMFDATYFGFTPREAEITCPQLRMMLEVALETLEHGGYGDCSKERNIGVFAGASNSRYFLENILPNTELRSAMGAMVVKMGGDKDFIATRLAYKLNLTGPSLSLNTACSTSLVAIAQACLNLTANKCDMALAGAASISQFYPEGYLYEEGGIYSPDGHCRPFDEQGAGTRNGNGLGMVLLKRLDKAIMDGDTVHAVIKGIGINNDGNQKVGYVAPSMPGQSKAIRDAIQKSGIQPDTIDYVETHGTATHLGDPIEISALSAGFGNNPNHTCALGSVKANIGHLDAAAGIAGLIKTVQAIKYKQLPPSINFNNLNSQINLGNSPFHINVEQKSWPHNGRPRRAAVSSFGIGGTNVHMILEENESLHEANSHRNKKLLLLSAKTENDIENLRQQMINQLLTNNTLSLHDVEYTLHVGREFHDFRQFIVCESHDEAIDLLSNDKNVVSRKTVNAGSSLPIIFMFPGQGTQYVNMAKGIYEQEPYFRDELDKCSELLKPEIGVDIRELLYPQSSETADDIDKTIYAQPAIFVVEYCLAKLLMSWGIKPVAMIGHSLGEYVAACLSGVFSLADALKIIAIRARLMQSAKPGCMLSVLLERTQLADLLKDTDCEIAAVNSPTDIVVSGPQENIEQLKNKLSALEIVNKQLNTSHAFHSHMMDDILDAFKSALENIQFGKMTIPFMSNLSGKPALERLVTTPAYWVNHLRNAVEFSSGIINLSSTSKSFFIEVGPGNALTSLVKRHQGIDTKVVAQLTRHQQSEVDDGTHLLEAVGKLWQSGVDIDWKNFHQFNKCQRVPFSTYPFAQSRYWVDAKKNLQSPTLGKKKGIKGLAYVSRWKKQALPAAMPVGSSSQHQNVLMFAQRNEVCDALANSLRDAGKNVICVYAGEAYSSISADNYSIDINSDGDFEELIKAVIVGEHSPWQLVYMWGLSPVEIHLSQAEFSVDLFEQSQKQGIQALLKLVKAILAQRLGDIQLNIISENIHRVSGCEDIFPANATITGLQKAMKLECPEVSCFQIDVDSAELNNRFSIKSVINDIASELLLVERVDDIALRNHRRWLHNFEYAYQEDYVSSTARKIREDGVYVITGGLGQVGLNIAEFIARVPNTKIALLSRSAFPAAEDWESWCSEHGEKDKTSRKIRKLEKVFASAQRVELYQVDVSDCAQLEAVFLQIEEKLGSITGVVHAAGLAHGIMKPIQDVSERDFLDQYQTKVIALHALDKVLANREIDFCILTSTLASVLGGLGFSAYAAANAYMDAFAKQKNLHGYEQWTAINWDRWDFSAEEVANSGLSAMEGIKTFEYALTFSDIPQLLFSKRDISVPAESDDEQADGADEPVNYSSRTLENEYVAARNDVERGLVEIWQDLLGVETIGIHDNLFDLGGHSLLAIQLISKMKKAGYEILVRELIDAPTIAGVSETLNAQQHTAQAAYLYKYQEGDTIYSLPNKQLLFKSDFNNHWNVGTIFNIVDANEAYLQRALSELLQEQEGLRHVYYLDGEVVKENVLSMDDLEVMEVVNFTSVADENLSAAIEEFANKVQRSLDITKKLHKFVLFKCPKGQPDRFLWVVHHSVMDGFSVNIFFQEIFTRYLSYVAQVDFTPLPKTQTIVEWGNYLHQFVNSPEANVDVEYWISREWDKVGTLIDYPAGLLKNMGSNPAEYGNDFSRTRTLAKEFSAALIDGAAVYKNVTSADVIFSAFTAAVAGFKGSSHVRFEMIVNGRDKIIRNVDVDRTIGWFADWVPIVTEIDFAKSPLEQAVDYHNQLAQMPNAGLTFNAIRHLSEDGELRTNLKALGNAEFNINFVPPALRNMDELKNTNLPLHLISGAKESAGQLVGSERSSIVWPSYIQVGVNKNCYEFTWMARDNIYNPDNIEKVLELWIANIVSILEEVNNP
jgi:amino acid adenylation domain-containing protein